MSQHDHTVPLLVCSSPVQRGCSAEDGQVLVTRWKHVPQQTDEEQPSTC